MGDCSNIFQAYNQSLYPKMLEAAYEALESFKYDPWAYSQPSTSTSWVSESNTSDTRHIFIQDGGHQANEEIGCTIGEKGGESSYAQTSKEKEYIYTIIIIIQLVMVERIRSPAIDVEEKDTLPRNVPTLQSSMGKKLITSNNTETVQSHVTNDILDN